MLGTASNQGTVWTSNIGQGLPNARLHDAQPAQVNPAWACQPILAAHRVAKLPDQRTLMGEVFRDTRFPHQPTRQTLTDTIKVLAATGNVSADQARWLADNKSHPNRLWSAIGYLSRQAAHDSNGNILQSVHTALIEQAPIKEIARFVTAWAKHLPEAIDPLLVDQLCKLMNHDKKPLQPCQFDWALFNSVLDTSVNKIAAELNSRMEPNLRVGDEQFSLTLEFGYDIGEDGALAIAAAHPMGVQLELDPDSLQASYWKALVQALPLLQQHLFPISTTVDLLDYNDMMIEESVEELKVIWAYLERHNLEDSAENVEAAIAASDTYMVEDADSYDYYCAEYHQRQEIRDHWKLDAPVTISGLRAQVANLPQPNDEREQRLALWLNELADALPNADDTAPWWESLEPETAEVNECHVRRLDDFTPVYGEDEGPAFQAASDMHDMYMQGDDLGPVLFSWDSNPETLLRWVDTLNTGYTLLAKLFAAGNGHQIS